MGAKGLPIRGDVPAAELRRLARREKDRAAAARLQAIAGALEGLSRAEAARLAGMERQALRDAVLRYTPTSDPSRGRSYHARTEGFPRAPGKAPRKPGTARTISVTIAPDAERGAPRMPEREPLLLLSGLLSDAALWRAQVDGLADVAAPVIPDLAQDDSIAGMALRALAAAPPRFALAGLSMGGYVALEIMRRAPERVSRLALLGTSARTDTPEQAERRREAIALAEGGRFESVADRMLPNLLHPDRLPDEGLVSAIRAMARRLGKDGFLRKHGPSWDASIAARSCPGSPARPWSCAAARTPRRPWRSLRRWRRSCPAPGSRWSSVAATCRPWSGRRRSPPPCGAGWWKAGPEVRRRAFHGGRFERPASLVRERGRTRCSARPAPDQSRAEVLAAVEPGDRAQGLLDAVQDVLAMAQPPPTQPAREPRDRLFEPGYVVEVDETPHAGASPASASPSSPSSALASSRSGASKPSVNRP